MIYQTIGQMKKMLGQLDKWFDAAEAHAKAKSFDVNVLLQARLSPDQFPLVQQVQIACDTCKLGASRLTGKDAPKHDDKEQTFGELRSRVKEVIQYLGAFTEEDFRNAPTRSITQPRWEGKVMTGSDYFLEHVTPNFFFHFTHVYAILRHNGVAIGKRDYLGALNQRLP